MKVIIAGSRTITDYTKLILTILNFSTSIHIEVLKQYTNHQISEDEHREHIMKGITPITEVVSGGARGVDALGEKWAREHNKPCKIYSAHWDKYGKKAGYLRNIEMADYADALIAIWDGKSKGTKHMIDIAKKKGLKVFVYELN